MKIKVADFVNEFIENKIKNTKTAPNVVEEFIHSKLEIIDYLSFQTKKDIVEMVVAQIITEEDGVKRVDRVAQYLTFMMAMLYAHTSFEPSGNPYKDYDELSKYGLLEPIFATFQKDYSECKVLLKMAVDNELEDNNLNVIIGKFLNGILGKLDGVGNMFKGFAENTDLSKLLGTNIKEEDVTKIIGFIDKFNK